MINDKEAVESPTAGDVWELNGIPELVILSVSGDRYGGGSVRAIEYCNKKKHFAPGKWEWDLSKYLSIPVGSLKQLVCKPVGSSEEPVEFLMHISSCMFALGVVDDHHHRMNRHLNDWVDPVVIEKDGITLTFKLSDDSIATMSDGTNEIELSLFTLWSLGDSAYEKTVDTEDR